MEPEIILKKEHRDLILLRLAHQIVEEEDNLDDVVFLGIQPRGIFMSDAIVENIKTITKGEVKYGKLDITFYRDDIREELRLPNAMEVNFSLEGKRVILIDDVLYTGRTIRAALDAMLDFGRPSSVKLCVLINRWFGRELPIQPDYCGLNIDTFAEQKVKANTESGDVILYS